MQFTEFKAECIKTESRPEVLGVNEQYLYVAMCLGYQVTNFLDRLKKAAFYNKVIPEDALASELDGIIQTSAFLDKHAESAVDREADLDVRFADSEGNHTEVPFDFSKVDKRVVHAFVGSFTESGELLKALLSSLSEDKPIDRVNVSEEFGDMDWYKAIAFDALELSETSSRNAVIAKLRKRYESGKFSQAAAINRDVAAEVEILTNETL